MVIQSGHFQVKPEVLFIIKFQAQLVGQKVGRGVKVRVNFNLLPFRFALNFNNFSYTFHVYIITYFFNFGYLKMLKSVILLYMNKIDIAGLKVDELSKNELLENLENRIRQNQKTWMTTLYSEFLLAALNDRKILDMLNKADIAVADGMGIIWAAKYVTIPLTAKKYYTKIIQAIWQAKYSVAAILFKPSWVKSEIKETIPGSSLVLDLAKMAAKNNWSIYLLGGFGDTAKLAANKLSSHMTNLNGRQNQSLFFSGKNPDDPSIIEDIKKARPDLLFVAYGPIKQERWIAANLENLPVKMIIGLGGTFDYLAGKRLNPPKFMRKMGLEWLFRLFTQPYRIKRIFNATFGLIWALIKTKVFLSLPYRPNVVSVVLNDKNEIFIGKFNPEKGVINVLGYPKNYFENYWQLPQGGIEPGEDVAEGAKRELWEETAMRSVNLIKISNHSHAYLWKDMGKRPLFIGKRYHYKGQEQKIAYFKFFGQEKEVVLDWDEFVEYKWVPWQNLKESITEQKSELIKLVLSDLSQMPELIKTA